MKTAQATASQDALDCLAACCWFKGLSDAALAGLGALAQWRTYQTGEHLYRLGDMPDGVFGVREGSFKIVTGSRDGRDAVTTVIAAGGWFGEIFLFAGQPYFADCLALQRGRVLFLARSDLLALCEQWPVVYRNLLTDVCTKARYTSWMSVQYKLASPELRLAHRLSLALQVSPQSSPGEWIELRERLSHELIAQMLGLSRPRVSQAMQALVRAGVLTADRGRVRVHGARLKAFCLDEGHAQALRLTSPPTTTAT